VVQQGSLHFDEAEDAKAKAKARAAAEAATDVGGFRLVPAKATGTCLQLEGGFAKNGAQLYLQPRVPAGHPGFADQVWMWDWTGRLLHSFKHTRKCLRVMLPEGDALVRGGGGSSSSSGSGRGSSSSSSSTAGAAASVQLWDALPESHGDFAKQLWCQKGEQLLAGLTSAADGTRVHLPDVVRLCVRLPKTTAATAWGPTSDDAAVGAVPYLLAASSSTTGDAAVASQPESGGGGDVGDDAGDDNDNWLLEPARW
jgi:hypothetical protein